MIEVDRIEIVTVLHEAVMRAIGRLAPAGGEHVMSLRDVAEALISVLADMLGAVSQKDIDHLTKLFRHKLEVAFAAREGSRH